jgi:two-component system OmpR family sensor kinase
VSLPYDSTRNTAIIGLLALGLVMTAGTAGLTGWAVGRTLRPVKRMTELAAEWSEHDLETRFELQGGTDEFSNLGNTLDVLLDRVATAIRNEQQLTAELAHELRTPLTTIRAEAELGLMYSDDLELNERLARVVTQVDRLHATITTLLVAARNMHGTHHRSDVYKVIRDLIAASPDHLPVELDARPGQVFVAASPELVDRIIGPVLDNALRHGREHIKVTARIDRSSVVVEVSDDGPGIEVGDQEAIFTAGIRADTSDGAGLGLALARRVAATARGSVTVTSLSSPTTFEIRLPAR